MEEPIITRYVRPHENDTRPLKLRLGEALSGTSAQRAVDALLSAANQLHDANGSFVPVRPQPAAAREAVLTFLERVLDTEVPGRSETALRAMDAEDFKLREKAKLIREAVPWGEAGTQLNTPFTELGSPY